MFDWWALRGLKWPVQFFFVKCYLGRSVVGLAEDAMKKREPQESFIFWPTRKSFKTYRSFSQAETLPGKKAAAASAKSTDYDPSIWGKLSGFVRNLGPVGAVFGGILGAVLGYFGLIHGMMRLATSTAPVASPLERSTTPQTNAPPGTRLTDAGTGDWLATTTHAVTVNDDAERIVLVTPSLLRTNKRNYAKGSELAGGVVDRILLNGVVFEGGRAATWDVLFPGHGRGPGNRR